MFVEEASLVLKQLMGHWMHDVCGNDHRATERGHFAQNAELQSSGLRPGGPSYGFSHKKKNKRLVMCCKFCKHASISHRFLTLVHLLKKPNTDSYMKSTCAGTR